MKYHYILLLCIIQGVLLFCSQSSISLGRSDTNAGAEQTAESKPEVVHEPCALVTKDDAAEVLGSQVKMFNEPLVTSGDMREQRCRYVTKTGLLDVKVYTPLSPTYFAQGKFEWIGETGGKIEKVSGIGDQARIGSPGGGANIQILKGNVLISIVLLDKSRVPSTAPPEESLKAFSKSLKKLAEKAMKRLD